MVQMNEQRKQIIEQQLGSIITEILEAKKSGKGFIKHQDIEKYLNGENRNGTYGVYVLVNVRKRLKAFGLAMNCLKREGYNIVSYKEREFFSKKHKHNKTKIKPSVSDCGKKLNQDDLPLFNNNQYVATEADRKKWGRWVGRNLAVKEIRGMFVLMDTSTQEMMFLSGG